jgi:hypothetical protein
MKTIIQTLLIQILLVCSLIAAEEPKSVSAAWFHISVVTQNLRYNVTEGDRDIKYLESGQKKIEQHLTELVRDGHVVEERINLKSIKEIGDGMDKILAFAQEIGEEYGYYVSLELIDFGIRRSLAQNWSEVDKPITIVVRLPEARLKQYKEVLKNNNLLAKKEAEDGTVQPATRPLLDAEGSQKPQPESEGRSR